MIAASPNADSTKPGTSNRPAGLGVLAQEAQPEDQRGEPDRDVDEEDPAPADRVRDEAAEHRPEGRRGECRHHHDRRRPGPFDRREGAEQHRDADRREHPASDALEHAEPDELADRLGQPAQDRSADEQDERGEEQPLGAEAITQPPAGRDPHRHRQRVAEDDPLDRLGLQFRADRAQGDVDDRRVEDVEEQRGHEDRGDDVLVGDRPAEQHDRRDVLRDRRDRHWIDGTSPQREVTMWAHSEISRP